VNLLLLDVREIDDRDRVTLTDARASHVIGVLKAQPGQTVRVGVVDGPLGTGTVESVAGGRVTMRCVFEPTVPDRPAVDVLLAVPRPKVMRRLWAQLSALGVGQIILTNAARVERHYFDTHILDEQTYRPLLLEGLQQARDTRVPAVSIHRQFRILVEDRLSALFGEGTRFVADPSGTLSLGDAIGHSNQRVLIAIGPEGGWNSFELALLTAHGFHVVGLGPRTLRVDTACVALLAIAHARMNRRSG
jgi:RsmE family RNA methyltransferase